MTLLLNLLTDRITSASGRRLEGDEGRLAAGHLALAQAAGEPAALLLPQAPEGAVGEGRDRPGSSAAAGIRAHWLASAPEKVTRGRVGAAADDHADAALARNRTRP